MRFAQWCVQDAGSNRRQLECAKGVWASEGIMLYEASVGCGPAFYWPLFETSTVGERGFWGERPVPAQPSGHCG